MCFSFEISISTFIFSLFISLYLLRKKLSKYQQQNIIFLMIVSLMQLSDTILWYINMEENYINYIVTSYIIPLILSLQILYNIFIINKNTNIFIKLITILMCIIIFSWYNNTYTIKSKNPFSSPKWGGKSSSFFVILLFLILAFYGRVDSESGWIIPTSLCIITYLYSYRKGGGFGSLWCSVSNLLALFYLYKYS